MKEGKAYIGDEIAEGNEAIVRFMGYVPFSNTSAWINETGGYKFVLSYNSMWSEIMPVVEKIMLVYPYNSITECLSYIGFYIRRPIKDINDLWICVSSFCKWYNTQNKQS